MVERPFGYGNLTAASAPGRGGSPAARSEGNLGVPKWGGVAQGCLPTLTSLGAVGGCPAPVDEADPANHPLDKPPDVIQVVGYLGSVGAAVMWMPQVGRVIRFRHSATALRAVSLGTYLFAIGFNALLLTYGLLNRAEPVAAAGMINLCCAAVIVVVLLRARRKTT